jgi:transcriptional regulator with XRE-family HTH domain
MPRKSQLSDRERQICARLREFREGTGLSRVVFAQMAGIDSSVLVRCEHGRTPLRFGVFNAIHQRYNLNPLWLGGGEGEQSWKFPFSLAGLEPTIPRGMLFSKAYDNCLERCARDEQRPLQVMLVTCERAQAELLGYLESHRHSGVSREVRIKVAAANEACRKAIRDALQGRPAPWGAVPLEPKGSSGRSTTASGAAPQPGASPAPPAKLAYLFASITRKT